MHYFIYPNGGHSLMLAHNLEILGHTYEFLDDFKAGLKIEENSDKINTIGGGLALIACDTTHPKNLILKKQLIKKVKSLNLIPVDGFKWIMSEILSYLKIEPHKTAALLHSGMSDGKYLGDIIKYLQNSKTCFVEIFTDYFNYQIRKSSQSSDDKILLIPFEYLKFLNFKVVAATGNFEKFNKKLMVHPKSIKIMIPHGYTTPLALLSYYARKDIHIEEEIKEYQNMAIDYFIVPSRTNYKLFLDMGIDKNKLVPLGYPSLDLNLKNHKDLKAQKSILIALYSTKSVDSIVPALRDLLKNGYKVIFRPKPGQEELDCNQNILKEFSTNELFKFDTNTRKTSHAKIDDELISEICCCVSDYSSLAFTLPLTNLRPCILYYPEHVFGKNFGKHRINKVDYSLANSDLHIVAKNSNDIIKAIKNLNLDEFKTKIKSYRDNEVYNLRSSSEAIANFISEKLNS